jgi:hypothetical protein
MAMPDVPEGMRWMVERSEKRYLNVSLVNGDCLCVESGYVDVGADFGRELDEAQIVTLVEDTAHRVAAAWQRKRDLDEIVSRNWPQP